MSRLHLTITDCSNNSSLQRSIIGEDIVFDAGNIFFYCDNLLHSECGPAVIWRNGTVEYYIEGKLHRIGGPAIIWDDGDMEYWIHGKYMTKKEHDMYNFVVAI